MISSIQIRKQKGGRIYGKIIELDMTEIAVPYNMDNQSVPEQRYRDVVKLLVQARLHHISNSFQAPRNESYLHSRLPVCNRLHFCSGCGSSSFAQEIKTNG